MTKTSAVLLLCIFGFCSAATAQDSKDPDLAGTWYPGTKEELSGELAGYFHAAEPKQIDAPFLAIISPHAGMRFSGPVAAYGYKAAEQRSIRTVVILGFSHRSPFSGIAVYSHGAFRTPLGDAKIDEKLAKALIEKNERIVDNPQLFEGENSIELQVPFIQYALPAAEIVPIAFGTQDYADAQIMAAALSDLMKERSDILIVASTDLSHYHPYAEANEIDRATIGALRTLKAEDLFEKARQGACEMCGLMPLATTLLVAQQLGYTGFEVLRYANSGDTFGDKSRVVGYVSAVIYKENDSSQGLVVSSQGKKEESTEQKAGETEMLLNDAQRKRLLEIARESVTSFVKDGKRKSFTEKDPVLNEEMGAFVTLRKRGDLRGCIGNMIGRGPLYQTVADMAIEAGTGDPRFPRLSAEELREIDIEISVLSVLKRVASADEIKIPGHGVLVRRSFYSGVYLPQVATETGWSKEEFLTSLCGQKAGIDPNAWRDPATELYVFTAEVFGEKE